MTRSDYFKAALCFVLIMLALFFVTGCYDQTPKTLPVTQDANGNQVVQAPQESSSLMPALLGGVAGYMMGRSTSSQPSQAYVSQPTNTTVINKTVVNKTIVKEVKPQPAPVPKPAPVATPKPTPTYSYKPTSTYRPSYTPSRSYSSGRR